MGAVATPQRPAIFQDPPPAERSAPRLFESPASGEVSLEDLILGVWEDLAAAHRAECPVCGGGLLRDGCRDCGAQLS